MKAKDKVSEMYSSVKERAVGRLPNRDSVRRRRNRLRLRIRRTDWTKIRGKIIYRSILLAFVLSLAGIICGVGFFVLAMLQMTYTIVAASSLILATSLGVFLWCYMWATAAA